MEWDPEEVAVGYDLSSIYEGVGENSTVPVISSVVNITDQADHPAVNITAVVKKVTEQVVEMVVNTLNSTTMAPTIVVPSSSSTPSTVSTIVKRVVEHLGKKPSDPVATVCFTKIKYITVFYSTIRAVYYRTVFYTPHPTLYIFCRPAAFHLPSPSCWWWRFWDSGWEHPT